jgi:hypothetical protein
MTSERDSVPETHKPAENWEDEISFAQMLRWYTFREADARGQHTLKERVPHARDLRHVDEVNVPSKCSDCKVAEGQLHVPGCEKERCPRCGGSAATCNCPRVETWHKLPIPDQQILVMSPFTKQPAGVVDPVVSFANGCAQLERFHIAKDDGCYIILVRPNAEAPFEGRVYVPSPWITPTAMKALQELPPLDDTQIGET